MEKFIAALSSFIFALAQAKGQTYLQDMLQIPDIVIMGIVIIIVAMIALGLFIWNMILIVIACRQLAARRHIASQSIPTITARPNTVRENHYVKMPVTSHARY